MKLDETNTDEYVIASFVSKSGASIVLLGDGYWHGDDNLAELANAICCVKHYRPEYGDFPAWASSTIDDQMKGKLTPYFSELGVNPGGLKDQPIY